MNEQKGFTFICITGSSDLLNFIPHKIHTLATSGITYRSPNFVYKRLL